jgi:hypothetical protein
VVASLVATETAHPGGAAPAFLWITFRRIAACLLRIWRTAAKLLSALEIPEYVPNTIHKAQQ